MFPIYLIYHPFFPHIFNEHINVPGTLFNTEDIEQTK